MKSAGRLKFRFKFQRRGAGQDRYGTTRGDYGDIIDAIPAGLQELRGGEVFSAQRLEGVSVVSILVRATAATRQLLTSDRAVNVRTGEVFEITQIDGIEAHARWLEILAKSGGAAQSLASDDPNGTAYVLEGGFWNDKGVWADARVWRKAA